MANPDFQTITIGDEQMKSSNNLSKSELKKRFTRKWNLRKGIIKQVETLEKSKSSESLIKFKLSQVSQLNREICQLDKMIRGSV